MEEEEGQIVTVTDEDGNEFTLEHLDTLVHNGQTYMAFFPTVGEDENPDDPDAESEYGLILLKLVQDGGTEELSTLDSEEEAETIYQKFMERLSEDEDGA